jgi:hypothetical protein
MRKQKKRIVYNLGSHTVIPSKLISVSLLQVQGWNRGKIPGKIVLVIQCTMDRNVVSHAFMLVANVKILCGISAAGRKCKCKSGARIFKLLMSPKVDPKE